VGELAISDLHEIDPVDWKALALSVDKYCRPFERGFVARGDVPHDLDLRSRELITHAFVKSPDLIVADQGTRYGVEDCIRVEVGQDAFNVPARFGSPIGFANFSGGSHGVTSSFY
jgi:hypothetical protein